ncbi:MAG: OmpP1/FadL family transporter [Thermoanaerobaculaceae bacterium]
MRPHSDAPRRAAGLTLALALLAAPAGLSAEEPSQSFEFTFSSPGARSMGFAGAFVPLADDATAAFANPAGLVQLVRPELSLELRLRGALESDEKGNSTLGAVNGVSFFSAVLPLGRWSFALYGHQLATLDFERQDSTASAGARLLAGNGERLKSLNVARLGFSTAYRLRDNLMLGVGLSHFEGELGLAPLGGSGGTRRARSTDWGLNAGVLWNPSERLRVGSFFREGPSLDSGAASTAPASMSRTLELPDSYGLGTAYRSRNGALTLAVEWDRVRYSSLRDGLAAIAGGDEGLDIADANELHVGAEYAFLKVNPVLAVRGGVWLDPDHRACSSTPGSLYGCDAESGGEVHVTTGFGMAFRRFQVDIGIDQSRSVFAFSLSGIVSF